MLQRIMVAVVCVPLIFVIFFFCAPIAIPAAIAILSMIGVHEALWFTGLVKNPALLVSSVLLAGLIPFWTYYGQNGLVALAALFVYFTVISVTAIASKRAVTVEQLCASFFFAALISYFLSSFVRLDQMEGGQYMILTPLVAAFLSDAFALFTGMLLGKHKLAPELSPKKTVEGAIGGLVGATLSMLVYGLVMAHWFRLEVSYPLLALYGALGSLVSHLGDLFFSYIKRQYGLKDFGTIFPGHGGVLDRFDSVIFCAPLIEILWRFLPAITFA